MYEMQILKSIALPNRDGFSLAPATLPSGGRVGEQMTAIFRSIDSFEESRLDMLKAASQERYWAHGGSHSKKLLFDPTTMSSPLPRPPITSVTLGSYHLAITVIGLGQRLQNPRPPS